MRIPSAFVLLVLSLALTLAAADKPRVFITESQALQLSGNAEVGETKGSLSVRGGTSPQNIEVIKNFQRLCPQVAITGSQEKADYFVRLDHAEASPVTPLVRGNKVVVLDKQQDVIYSNSTRLLSSAVKGACSAVTTDAQK